MSAVGWGRLVAAGLASLAVPAMARGQASGAPDSSGVLVGTLAGLQDDQPIAYATVGVVGAGRTIFADAKGAFRLSRLVPGSYLLHVRQIGYSPLDTTVVVVPGPEETTISVRLRRIALRLARVGIEGRRTKGCVATGVPDSAVNATLASVFSQVWENVDRLRLLLDEYPFRYAREEQRLMRLDPGGDSIASVDTAYYDSRARRPYTVGGIIYFDYDAAGRSNRIMYLPTFRDLADPAFLSAHCFAYKGTERLGGTDGPPVIRVDFRPASSISEPDVEGSIYLDAQRLVVRRAVFRMTRPQAADPPVIGLSVTTTFRELVPLVPVFDSVEVNQPQLPRADARAGGGIGVGGQSIRVTSIEEDRFLSFTFERTTPGEEGSPGAQTGGSPPPPPSATVVASQSTGAVALAGRVITLDGSPVAGATVGLFGVRDTAVTSDSGAFSFGDAPPGAHMLLVRRLGFQAAHVPVTIARDHPHTITVRMARSVPVLPTVVTTAQSRSAMQDVGLAQRMRAGVGQFLLYDQIQQRHAMKLSDLLQGLRGIRMMVRPLEYETSVLGTRGLGDCVSFVVDGVPQSLSSDHDIDLLMDPSLIGAIEVYSAAERPAGMGGPEERPQTDPQAPPPPVAILPKCHLVVIWTIARLHLPVSNQASASSDLTGTRGRPVFPNAGACEPQPAEDTIDVAMYATLQSAQTRATPDTAWSHYVDRVLAGLRSAFVMPSDLPLPVFGYAFREEPIAIPGKAASHMKGPALGVAPAMSNVVVFTLDSTGAVASIRVAASSLSGPGDTAVLAAVTDAAAAHAFPAAPASIHQREPIRFDLVVSTAQPAVGDRAIVLGRVSVPTWALRRQATLADGRQPSLAPERSAVAAVSDTMSATLEFVVDEQGRPAMATVRAVAASNGKGSEFDRAFVRRVTGALSQFRFEPALIGACPVPQITTQGFSYEQKAG